MAKNRYKADSHIRKIEFVLFNESAIRAAVTDARAGTRYVPEVPGGGSVSDPTAAVAVKNMTPLLSVMVNGSELDHPEEWLEVVGKVYLWCKRQDPLYYEVASRRYRKEHFVKICMELHLSQPNFYQIMERVRTYAALQAAQRGLIHVD